MFVKQPLASPGFSNNYKAFCETGLSHRVFKLSKDSRFEASISGIVKYGMEITSQATKRLKLNCLHFSFVDMNKP